jgi:hemoglobin/transferrin/lactoferrin receptor protein
MKKIVVAAFLWMWAVLGFSQTASVLDKLTQQGIPGVLIFSKSPEVAVHTDPKGQVDISAFKSVDSIHLQMIGYLPLVYSYARMEEMKFKIELTENPIPLTEVIISSYRTQDNKLEIPNRIEKLSMIEVAFQNPQTAADLLGTSGYAFIQKSQLGGGSPMIRGMATNRVLLVVDGVRMNNAIFRSGNLQNVISLDANALESTEILFGPGSVMYGSDAIGGVMNFNTLEPKFSDKANKLFTLGNALMRTSTANSEMTGHVDLNIGLKKWAFVTSFTRSKYADLRSGSVGGVNYFYRPYYVETIADKDYMVPNADSSLQVGSKYDQNNFMQKISFKPNTAWEFEYGFHFSETSSYNRYDRLYVMQTAGPYKNKLRWAEWYYGPQKWSMHRIGVTHSKATIAYDHLHLIAAVQNFEESRYDREFMVRELRMQKETVRALSFNLDLDKKLNERASINYGVELVHNTVGSFASLTHVVTDVVSPTVTRYPNGSTWESYGVYTSLKYKLTKKLIVNAGLRYSYYRIKAVFDTVNFPFPFTDAKMSNGTLNGSLGFVYAPTRSWQLYLNGATGFRAPNIDDMGKVFESTPGYLVVPNPDLKPEHAYNSEIGTVKTFGRFFKFDFAAYYTILNDAMERKDYTFNGQTTIRFLGNKSNIQAVQNIAKAQVYGIQTGFELNYKGAGLKSTFSFQDGKEQSGDSLIYYPLRHAAPMFGSVHLTYGHKILKVDFYILYNGKMDYEDLALTERMNASYAKDYSKDPKGLAFVASWYTLNFKVAVYANQHVALTAGVENITDRLYRPYSSGINAPGRNVIVSLRGKF